ncbi:MAG: GFA family protein [Candidatus Binatia bacterium]
MTTYTPSLLHGSCECGTCAFDVRVTPTARFICHCTICQAFTGKSFSDVTVLRAKDVELTNADQISFKKYRPPFNLERGLCLKCKKPVLEFGGFGAFKLAFIPASNFESQHLLPMPQMHIFYHRRLKDALDDLPKHSGYLRSQLAIGRMLMGSV